MKNFFKSFHKNRIGKRVTSLLVAGVLVMASMPVSEMYEGIIDLSNSVVVHAEPSRTPRTFNSVSDFVTYSQEYAANAADRCEDILTLAFSDTEIPSTFVSLGTSAYPFNGTIKLNATSGSTSYTLQLDKPLFDYVTDSVAIVKNGSTNAFQLNIQRTSDLADTVDSPLLANTVKHSGGTAKWDIRSEVYDDGDNKLAYKFSGVIGKMDTSAQIELTFDSSSRNDSINDPSKINGTSAIGLICGTMESQSKIKLSLKNGTNKDGIIESKGSHAGGIIGEMKNNSVLEFKSNSFVPTTNRNIKCASEKSAGGIVGYCAGGRIQFSSDFSGTVSIKDKIIGDTSVGGVFGYYSNTVADEIDLSKFNINCKTEGSSTGGVFGIAETSADLTVKDGSLAVSKTNEGGCFGGIIGVYKTSNHLKKLEISSVNVTTSTTGTTTSYGGVIGEIQDGTTPDYAYVKVNNLTHTATSGYAATLFGGVVGKSANKGNLLDIGTVTISTSNAAFTGGGLVGDLSKGVLRLSGITNLIAAPSASSDTQNRNIGQIVGKRVDALVYALGDGSNITTAQYGNDWGLKRSTSDVYADDIGTWGEIVRIGSVETNIVDYNSEDHTVTVKGFDPATTINNSVLFTLLALNIQLNKGDADALKFSSSATSRSASLLGASITISGTISLAGTGITGLMRDDYNASESEIGVFTGTITGESDATINLAIGERYGVYSGATLIGRGAIFNHRFNGLLARTGAGASLSSLTIGSIGTEDTPDNYGWNINSNAPYIEKNGNTVIDVGTYVGGVAARVTSGITLTDVDCVERVNFNVCGGTGSYIGGYIGEVTKSNNAAVTIQKSSSDAITVSPTFIITGDLSSTHAVGGAIGRINSTNTFTTTISDVQLNTNIDATAVTKSDVKDIAVSGLISKIVSISNSTTDNRTLSLTNLTADGVTIKNSAADRSGGILGYSWLNTNVEFSNVQLSKSGDDINTVQTTAKYAGGLVFSATGHWTVPSGGIVINSFNDSRSSPTSFGMLVNDGYNGKFGLFLELTASDSYTLGTDNITVPTPTQAYDELVAYTSSTSNYLKNGKDGDVGVGIISITTTTPSGSSEPKLIMLSSGTAKTNSYQNKYNKNTEYLNKYSRYYYNLTTIRNKDDNSKSDGEKLLLWSLYHYASSNLSTYFPNAYARSGKSDKIDGTDFDMINLSYYPIDINAATEIGNVKITFYNAAIERCEAAKNNSTGKNTDGIARSTLQAKSQHYLMHFGLFKNVTKSLSTSGDIILTGNVGNSSDYTGTLICGNLTGSFESSAAKEIVLNGITLKYPTGYLLINSIGNNAILKLRKVRTGGSKNFSGATVSTDVPYAADAEVAASLIGSVEGTGITLEFEKIKLDSRDPEADSDTDYSSLNDIYGTTVSIFTDSVLLAVFDVDSGSSAVYNFEESEDWDGSTHKGNVTYGKEIITSVEFNSKQKKYYDQTHYTHPIPVQTDAAYEDFENDFLPYVAESTADGESDTREIRVNVKISGIVKGCGTYNHPYEIEEDDQLPMVAQAIAGTAFPDSLRLPKINGSAMDSLNHWSSTCETFSTIDAGENYTFTETVGETSTTYTWTKDQIRLYLASAYYMIMKDIELDSSFTGLGSVAGTDTTGKYSFRGVIVGKAKTTDSTTTYPTITNKAKRIDLTGNSNISNTPGLIAMSNGSVIKDITIKVELDSSDLYNYKINQLNAYAYNDKCPNYGAVINKIMGGDNIIDNVKVDFNGAVKVLKKDKDYAATIGGYVGCVVNGGLVFRNVADSSLTTNSSAGFTVKKVNDNGSDSDYSINGVSISNMTSAADLAHLYVNPFVGRVINGYVFKETNGSYNISEDGKYSDPDKTSENNTRSGVTEVTMHNTRKNYVISDIDASQNYQSTDDNKKNSVLTFKEKTTNSGLYNKIEVPNSQALFIMSLIAQSGVGCAGSDTANTENVDYAYTISFDGSDLRAYSGNKQGNTYKASRHANYDNIGTSASSAAESDYDISKLDTVNSKTAVPYIIYKYTSSYSSGGTTYYPARSLTKRYFYIELTGSSTYYLPDAFRGIGFIGSDDINDFMKIYGFNGNGKTIDMNSMLYHYKKRDDAFFNGANINMNSGLALFNRLTQYCADTSNTRAYDSNTDNQIYNFTLSGYISADCLTSSGAETYNTDEGGGIFRTAGLVSYANVEKYYNVASVTLNNIHVRSCEYAGGLFAKMDTGKIYINNCNATNLTVEGYCRTGGFIGNNNGGTQYDGVFINTANEASSSTLSNVTVLHNGTSDNKFSCVGGVVGQFYTSKTDLSGVKNQDNYGHVVIRNITLTNSRVESVGVVGKVGGIMGSLQQSTASLFLNCNIINTNIKGQYSGGIIGDTTASNDVYGMRIVNCTVSGTIDQTTNLPNYSISGTKYSGGIIGYDKTKSQNDNHYPKYNGTAYKLNVEGCLVENYKICGVNKDAGGSGGVAGTIANANTNYTFKIADTKVNNCLIQSSNSQTERGTGAIIGYNATSGKYVYGRNVVASNNIVQNTANTSDGLVGNLIGNAKSGLLIKLVGYSRNDNKKNTTDLIPYDIGRSSGTDNIPSTCNSSSYIIYSDFSSKSTASSPNKNKASSDFDRDTFVGSGVRGTGQEYFPYAIVNPAQPMGTGSFLTSDGAALNDNNEPIVKSVLNDNTAHGYIGCGTSAKTAVQTAADNTDDSSNKISTYKTEMPNAEFSFDFPVVVINNQTQQDSAALIDNYIRVITNSALDYRNNQAGVYKINNIYACTYKNGKYSIDTSNGVAAGLKYSTSGNGVFFMEKGYADSNQDNNQISLIDVEFFDPNDSTKVAYHLYVPVLTKKMVSFNFNSASLTGTDFKISTSNASSPTPYVFGNKLAEALGTWYTSYIMYTYPRSELQDLVDSGKGLSWNHNKVITLNYKNTDGKLNDTTKLVLIDMNNADKAYYSTMGSIRTGTAEGQTTQADQINLKDFMTSTSGGTAFVQKNLHDLVTVTAEAKSSGTYAELAQGDDPSDYVVIKAKLNGVEKTFKYVGENNGGTHKLTVDSDGYERYFLSFLTPSTGTLYDYTIACPKNLSSQAGGLKGLRNDSQSSYTTIVIGNLFKQTVELEKVALENNESSWIVDSVYNQIQVNVNTTIEISNPSYSSYLTSYLNDPSIHLYQAFVLYLNKHKEDGSDTNVIGGNPGVTTSFTIDDYDSTAENPGPKPFEISTNEGVVNEGSITSYPGGKTYAMLEKHDIKQQFIDSPLNKITISSHSIIDYSDGNDRLEGFPEASSRGTIGVNISAKSNLSYNGTEEKIVYGTMSGNATPPSTINYYREDSGKVSLSYDAKIIDDAFDKDGILSKNKSQLGLNARNLADASRTSIPLETVASYNASNVTDFSKAKSIKCTLTLYKKTDDGNNVEYEQVSDLSDYFTGSIKLKSTGTSMVSIDQTVTVPSASYVEFTGTNVDITKKAFDADIDFNVKIKDDGFNEYANYKVMLTVQLFQSDGTTPVDGSLAYNHIVYTNAKIDPSIIRAS